MRVAARQQREELAVVGDAVDVWVQLEEGPTIAGPRVAPERSRAEPDDAYARGRMALTQRADRLADRRAAAEVQQRLVCPSPVGAFQAAQPASLNQRVVVPHG